MLTSLPYSKLVALCMNPLKIVQLWPFSNPENPCSPCHFPAKYAYICTDKLISSTTKQLALINSSDQYPHLGNDDDLRSPFSLLNSVCCNIVTLHLEGLRVLFDLLIYTLPVSVRSVQLRNVQIVCSQGRISTRKSDKKMGTYWCLNWWCLKI